MPSIGTTLEQIQTADLRSPTVDEAASVVLITEAIQATGLGAGATFHFDPTSVELLDVLLAFGEPGPDREEQARFTRPVRRLSADPELLELEIPVEGLRALDAVSNASDDAISSELTVWAGSQMLGFAVSE